MPYKTTIEQTVFAFADLKDLMAKATPERSGDQLAGIAAEGPVERLAAQMALADLPLKAFLADELISSEMEERCSNTKRQRLFVNGMTVFASGKHAAASERAKGRKSCASERLEPIATSSELPIIGAQNCRTAMHYFAACRHDLRQRSPS